MPVNLALWNGETRASNLTDLKIIDVFCYQSIFRIVHVSMAMVKCNRLKKAKIRDKFGPKKSLSEIWQCQLLKFVR